MNVINRFLLAVVLAPVGLYKGMGVNTFHLKSILNTKLIMDDRRPNAIHQTRQKKDSKVTLATVGTMVMSALLGALFLISFFVGQDFVTHLTVYFSMYIFMLASTLISDFTSVLIDIRDNFIILPKPVNDRTVVLARLLHIIIHISKLVLPMTLPAVIYMAINAGIWATVVFFFLVIFATMFTIFLINALYIFILKITTPEKFQNVISYFQIFFAIFIYASYQLVPRMINKGALDDYDISNSNWVWLAPPYWFAAAWNGFTNFVGGTNAIVAMLLSFILPFASIYVVIKYFAPAFNQKLSLINSSNTDAAAPSATGKRVTRTTSAYASTLAQWFSKAGAERMAFLLTWKMTARSKDFKLKVYPAFGYIIVMLILPFVSSRKLSWDLLTSDTTVQQFTFIGFLYFTSFILMTVISQITFSDKYKASWIYYTTPVKAPGEIINGAFKASMAKFYFPIVLLVSVIAVVFIGPSIIPNLLLALVNVVLICTLITYLTVKQLPFSIQQSNNAKTGNFVRMVFTLLIPTVIAIVHYFIHEITPVVLILIVMAGVAIWYVQGSIKNTSWSKFSDKYEE